MNRKVKTLICVLIMLCMALAITAAPAEGAAGVVNRNDGFELQMAADNGVTDNSSYLAAINIRPESYDPASVLISGMLYAPAGTEILQAEVQCGEKYEISGSDILRTRIGANCRPGEADGLPFTADEERAGFAFIFDESARNPADGTAEAQIKLTLSSGQEINLITTVTTESFKGRFYDVTRAIRDWAVYINDEGRPAQMLQARLAELDYLTPEEAASGKCDQTTLDAANRLLAEYGYEQNAHFLSAAAVGLIESDLSRKGSGEETVETAETAVEESGGGIADTLKGTVALFGREIPLWILIAAGAALVVLVVLVILLILGRKRKNGSRNDEAAEPVENAYITAPEEAGVQILTIGDEPTMDLNSMDEPAGGAFFGDDEPTTDLKEPGYVLKIRMIYEDVFLDKELKLMEGGQAIIGRGSEAAIQTNLADTSISHRHGVFTAIQGKINYQDESRNGTKYNGQRTIYKGDTVTIPMNTKVQLEIGAHKILVIAVRG